MIILSVDPGIDTGVALWRDGKLLTSACIDRNIHTVQQLCTAIGVPQGEASYLVCELPQIYRAAHSKGDPNDLMPLAVEVGWFEAFASLLWRNCTCVQVTPRAWKGQVPKRVCNQRTLNKLTAQELNTLNNQLVGVSESKKHNVLDAIGIGLWFLKR